MLHNAPNYSFAGRFAEFTRLRNKGGLVRASSDVLKVIKITEKILGTETQQFSHLDKFDHKMYEKVLHTAKVILIRCNVFPLCKNSRHSFS